MLPLRVQLWRIGCFERRLRQAGPDPQATKLHVLFQRKNLSLITILYPPVAFCGLAISLWAYKCLMMVVFQNKIIYMPNLPPFSRSEKIEDYQVPRQVTWKSECLLSSDGTRLSVTLGKIAEKSREETENRNKQVRRTVIAYFQGNGGSTPARLPNLSNVLTKVNAATGVEHECMIAALSYRGFWTSAGRPTQGGIEKDALALLQWLTDRYGISTEPFSIILWGQSLGAAVGISSFVSFSKWKNQKPYATKVRIAGIVLETPFTSTKDMLQAIYPWKWVPYRYLYPFIWNKWDSIRALITVKNLERHEKPSVLLVKAEKDELVPSCHSEILQQACLDSGLSCELFVASGALHTNVTESNIGRSAIANFIVKSLLS